MAKFQCKICGKNSESEFCFKHKNRKPLAKTGGLKNSGKKLGRKKLSEEEKMENQIAIDRMWALFEEVFNERGPYSQIDGTYLGKELRSWMVDHLLEKSQYPHLKYEKDNLFLVTFEQHQKKTNGFPYPIHAEAIEKAKQRFGII